MSKSKSARPSSGSTSGRPSASSLTDAVVAALAEVEKSQSDARVPAEAKSDAKPTAPASAPPAAPAGAGAEKKREDTAPFEREAPKAKAPDPEVTFSEDKTLDDGGLPPGAAVAVVTTERVGDARSPAAPTAKEAAPTEPPPAAAEDATVADATAADAKPSEPKPAEPKPAEPKPAEPTAGQSTAEENEKTTAKHALVGAGPEQTKPTPPGIAVDYFGRTDVGLVREHNEDNFLVVDLAQQKRGIGASILHTKIEGAGTLFAVCDGMGGAAAGEVASQMAVDTIHEMMQNGGAPRDRDHFARRLVRSIEEAGSRIFAAAKMDRSRRGMGTTSTVAGLIDKTLFVGQVGDSRAYVLRHLPDGSDQFSLITKDQSLVNQLIEAGQLTEEEAEAFEHSNIILQALGTTEEVTVDLTFLELRRGDRLLMCSDGLSGLVHGDMIKEVVKTSRDLIECANQLIAMANAGGGHDNITVVLAEFDGEDLKVASPDDKVAYMQYPLPPEDPKDPDPAPRATTIKSGGPKPGSDVKHDGATTAAAQPSDPGGNRALLIGVLLVVIVLVGIAVLLFSGGEAQSSAPESRTTTLTHGTGTHPRVVATNLHVLSNLPDATLYVDGVSRGALSDDMHVTVDPGDHHVEARREGEVLASADVTLTSGGTVVSLVAAEPPLPATDLAPMPPSDLAPPSAPDPSGAIPTGADLPEGEPPPVGAPAP